MQPIRKFLLASLVAAVLVPGAALAQDPAANYPSRPIKIIVPFPPGGSTDIAARLIGEKLQAKWGQLIIVENRPGLGGNIGSDIVAKSAPDGYTLIHGVTGSHAINISLFKKMPYHPLKDFEPITQTTLYPVAIVVHPSFPANNIQELLAMIRREPGKWVYATDGTGTGSHLTMELLLYKAGVKMQFVPYKGSSPMLADVMGQQAPIGITGITLIVNAYKTGKLKVHGVASQERSPAAPELPTIAEQGFPGLSGEAWTGFFAPKGTPRSIVDKLAAEMVAAMRSPDAIKRMADLGTPFVSSGPDAFRAFVAKEIEKWGEAVRVSGVSVD